MNARKAAFVGIAVAAAAACIFESRRFFAIGFGGYDGSEIVRAQRATVERFVPKGGRVTMYRSDSAERPSHVVNSMFLSVAWAAGAGNVDERRELDGSERYIVSAPASFTPAGLESNPRYRELSGPNGISMWARDDAPLVDPHACGGGEAGEVRGAGILAVARESGEWREALGLLAPLALSLLMLALALRRAPSKAAVACAAAVFALNALFALSHTFTGPCGTGVFGGRAKALVESGWNLAALADPGLGEYFQCAYPPLQAIVTAFGYAVAGRCGEWLTQLGPVMFLASSFLVMAHISTTPASAASGESGRPPTDSGDAARCILLAACCVGEPLVHATGNFCAEPLLVLTVASGWTMVMRGDRRGWFLVGLSGLVKDEGLFYAPAVVASEAAAGRLERRGMIDLALGLAPVAVWHVGSRLLGASLYDYAPPWRPDVSHALCAARELLLELLLHPWRHPFPVFALGAAVGGLRPRMSGRPGIRVIPALAFFATCSLGICFAFSLSRATDFKWHVSCLPRLLAPVSVLSLSVLLRPSPPRRAYKSCFPIAKPGGFWYTTSHVEASRSGAPVACRANRAK